ncbi:hypothetical protein GR255_25055, partial [Mycobacterium tuberculosis]|nr:hypothetical protein [Mycobacterium tuberculosis]
VKQLSDQDMMLHSIIENLQRENLNPIEEAKAYQSLIDKGFTHTEIAEKMGKSRPYITNLEEKFKNWHNLLRKTA